MVASYEGHIDWDGDGGLNLGDFEFGLDGWVPGGTVPPSFAQSTVRAYRGGTSGLITWGVAGSFPQIQHSQSNLVVGRQYTLSAWVYVPTGSIPVFWAVAGVTLGSASTVTNQWTQITCVFTATATTHSVQIWPDAVPAGGEQAWVDLMRITGPGEDVSANLLDREPITVEYGRDQARALSPPRPGEATFDLDNRSRAYSPENGSSPLVGLLGPGRQVTLTATLNAKAYAIYHGFTDDYELAPGLESRSAGFTAVDGLGRLRDVPISTALYPAVRTGEAVNLILDAIGWTAARDVDPGGSTLRWWWEEDIDAFAALQRILSAEGPSAFIHIGPNGAFVFRDRHHRLLRTESTSVQATFRADEGTEPVFLLPFGYNIGWRDIVNVVEFSVTERDPGVLGLVWESLQALSIAPGQTRTIDVAFKDAVWAVQQPTAGGATSEADIINTTANQLDVTLSRTSGKTLRLFISVPLSAGGSAEVQRIRLRGYPLETVHEQKVIVEDAASIGIHGRRTHSGNAPHITTHDAAAVADIILGQRAERLPTVEITVIGANDTRLLQQLTRNLSDRVRIIEPETGLDAHFYIEKIRHEISEAGRVHKTKFGCEKVRATPGNLFRFDTAGAGFDDGVFAPSGRDDPDTMFRFDVAGQGFDDGLFAN